jgi:hypothetical protein
VGFNPFRDQRRTALDLALVVGAFALAFAAVLWAIAGS